MSSAQARPDDKAEEFIFVEKRHPDRSGWLKPSDIKVGSRYMTQYGETTFVTNPKEYLNRDTGEMSLAALVKIRHGADFEYRFIDLTWIGLMPNHAGLWRKGSFCNEFLHDLSCELID